jgi:hypothetical protein
MPSDGSTSNFDPDDPFPYLIWQPLCQLVASLVDLSNRKEDKIMQM